MRGQLNVVFLSLIVLAGAQPSHADPGAGGQASRATESRAPQADYSTATWSAAHKKNFTAADRGPDDINTVVVHVTQGSYEGTKSWFKSAKAETTTHYVVRSADGAITQMVGESDIAWHAGNWDYNKKSIGIEHEGYVDEPDKWFTEEMYRSSAKLVRDICKRNDIPMDRDHIIGHVEVPGADHTDPGSGWDWDYYMDLLRGEEKEDATGTVDNSEANPGYSEDWSTARAEDQYGDDYAWASPRTQSDPMWFDVPRQQDGRYRVEVRYPESSENNTRTPYIVSTDSGYEIVEVDQTTDGGQWRSLGEFDMDADQQPSVGVSRWTAGEGRVVADSVRLIPVD